MNLKVTLNGRIRINFAITEYHFSLTTTVSISRGRRCQELLRFMRKEKNTIEFSLDFTCNFIAPLEQVVKLD